MSDHLAELGTNPERDRYTILQFDGAFAASDRYGVLAATELFEGRMRARRPGPFAQVDLDGSRAGLAG